MVRGSGSKAASVGGLRDLATTITASASFLTDYPVHLGSLADQVELAMLEAGKSPHAAKIVRPPQLAASFVSGRRWQ